MWLAVDKLDSAILRMIPRVALVITSKLSLSEETIIPSPNGQPDASGGGSHLPQSESNCQELAGPWQSASYDLSACIRGPEEKHRIHCAALCCCTRWVSGS